ncbi:MAG: hypothetical protein AABW79_03350 [Nanoarchaeota archaeon]
MIQSLKTFEEYVKKKTVRKQSPDIQRASSLIKESDEKRELFLKILKILPKNEIKPNFIIENVYDILIELLRSKLLKNGFNAGNSHEAEVSYMRNLKFPEEEVQFMNQLRYHRNGIKYYGKIFNEEYAVKVLEFLKSIQPRLIKMLSS